MEQGIVIFWFRRDLRLEDNTGLLNALGSGYKVLPLFIFDKHILQKLEKDDPRVQFICDCINRMNQQLAVAGSSVITMNNTPEEAFILLCKSYKINAVYANRDYESYSINRDERIRSLLAADGIPFFTFKDHVIFEQSEIVKSDGKPYTVYTPYSLRWLQKFEKNLIKKSDSASLAGNFSETTTRNDISPESVGFRKSVVRVRPYNLEKELITGYNNTRDIPSIAGTSMLSPHLRFGTISIREVLRRTWDINQVFVKELIWREFFIQILFHFPHVADHSFRPRYDRIEWENNEELFEKWRCGLTGFPIVDAGMRELAETGYMHNRVRMITANFLTRYLLTDWRWGETWFSAKLLDHELALNNGNWQWSAGTGCDAAPYFRIFNPFSQQRKFDPDFTYIKKWIPEFGTRAYPEPAVNLSEARNRALRLYKAGME